MNELTDAIVNLCEAELTCTYKDEDVCSTLNLRKKSPNLNTSKYALKN